MARSPLDRPQGLFRGSEYPRLISLLMFTVVLGLVMLKAREPKTWEGLFGPKREQPLTLSDLQAAPRQAIEGFKRDRHAKHAAAKTDASKTDALETNSSPSDSPHGELSEVPSRVFTGDAPIDPPNDQSEVDKQRRPKPSGSLNQPAAAADPEGLNAEVDEAFLDEDGEELAAIEEEFEVVEDLKPLSRVEMPAYWRLIRWSENRRLSEMKALARRDVQFADLFHDPGKFRGQLIRLEFKKLLRNTSYESLADENPLNADRRVFIAIGTTEDSRRNPYWAVYTKLPEGMPLGDSLIESGTFYGYFLKLEPYESGDSKRRASPILIGRMVWHPRMEPIGGDSGKSFLYTALLGAAFFVLFALRWATALLAPRKPSRPPRPALDKQGEPIVPLETWLDQAETPDAGLTTARDPDDSSSDFAELEDLNAEPNAEDSRPDARRRDFDRRDDRYASQDTGDDFG